MERDHYEMYPAGLDDDYLGQNAQRLELRTTISAGSTVLIEPDGTATPKDNPLLDVVFEDPTDPTGYAPFASGYFRPIGSGRSISTGRVRISMSGKAMLATSNPVNSRLAVEFQSKDGESEVVYPAAFLRAFTDTWQNDISTVVESPFPSGTDVKLAKIIAYRFPNGGNGTVWYGHIRAEAVPHPWLLESYVSEQDAGYSNGLSVVTEDNLNITIPAGRSVRFAIGGKAVGGAASRLRIHWRDLDSSATTTTDALKNVLPDVWRYDAYEDVTPPYANARIDRVDLLRANETGTIWYGHLEIGGDAFAAPGAVGVRAARCPIGNDGHQATSDSRCARAAAAIPCSGPPVALETIRVSGRHRAP